MITNSINLFASYTRLRLVQDPTDLSRSWSSHHDTGLEPEPNILTKPTAGELLAVLARLEAGIGEAKLEPSVEDKLMVLSESGLEKNQHRS